MVEIVCSHPTVDIHSFLPYLSSAGSLSLIQNSKFKIQNSKFSCLPRLSLSGLTDWRGGFSMSWPHQFLNSGDLQNDNELWCTADVSSGFCFGVHIRELEEEVKLLYISQCLKFLIVVHASQWGYIEVDTKKFWKVMRRSYEF
ncbi:uncharacterized protein LOC114297708 [Camellia sinensis]|uniref:uncharacterized protein LOC114297708 n=1 Tax=Camellia sinensis TaxID=4442 RepID=UPI0010366BAA|nr:uncharacterized protein LOC114297708 [Camellia sinensis]